MFYTKFCIFYEGEYMTGFDDHTAMADFMLEIAEDLKDDPDRWREWQVVQVLEMGADY